MRILRKIARAAVIVLLLLPVAVNIIVFAVNDIGAAVEKSRLEKTAAAENLTIVSSRCKVGRFDGCGNGTQYLAVVFLSEKPDKSCFEDIDDCRLYSPEKYSDEFGYAVPAPESYKCAAVRLASPENGFLYEFDLRGH